MAAVRRMAAASLLIGLATACIPWDPTGDGRADFTLTGCSTGEYYVRDSATGQWSAFDEPLAYPAVPVPGDYDGNGRWEAAWYDDGDWVTTGGVGTRLHDPDDIDPGGDHTGWEPVPGNYDGSDRAWELAFYDSHAGIWYIEGQEPISFGIGGAYTSSTTPIEEAWYDVPVPGDYDGDGDTDVALYRLLDGTVRTLEGGVIATFPHWIGEPLAIDVDHDPADEPVIYSVVDDTVTWAFADGSTVEQPDTSDGRPLPAPADYDGDGRIDLASWDWRTGALHTPDGAAIAPPVAFDPGGVDPRCFWPSGFPVGPLRHHAIALTASHEACFVASPPDCPPGISPG
jgi:hypothetical protein